MNTKGVSRGCFGPSAVLLVSQETPRQHQDADQWGARSSFQIFQVLLEILGVDNDTGEGILRAGYIGAPPPCRSFPACILRCLCHLHACVCKKVARLLKDDLGPVDASACRPGRSGSGTEERFI